MKRDSVELDNLIELLVDDALDGPARRALLERLDAEPGAWRRCALAFLEEQAWRAGLVSRAIEAGDGSPAKPRRAKRAPVALVGVAAGLLGAFALGWSVRGGATAGGRALVAAPAAAPDLPQHRQDLGPPVVAEQERPADTATAVTEARHETLLSPETVQELRKRGYEVQQPQRGVMALELANGRRVAVPVDEVRLHYIGNRTF